MERKYSIQSREGAKRVFYWFLIQRRILEKGLTCNPDQSNLVGKVLVTLIEAITDSCVSLEPLYSGGKILDTYAIARCICETIINVAFIQAEGEKNAERMLRHAVQKRVRDAKRELKIGLTTITLTQKKHFGYLGISR